MYRKCGVLAAIRKGKFGDWKSSSSCTAQQNMPMYKNVYTRAHTQEPQFRPNPHIHPNSGRGATSKVTTLQPAKSPIIPKEHSPGGPP